MDERDAVKDRGEGDILTTADNTLLAHIVPLYGKTEVVATEALRYILQQSEAARKALESMMVNAGVEVDSLSRFQTEAIGEEGERVDLVCYDEAGAERVLIEAKFWAGLTDNQPNTYLARLPENTHSALMFVAPAQRIETLWPELCRRAEEQHELTVEPDASTSVELRRASVGSHGHKMLVTSWRVVLEQMDSRASLAGDRTAVKDIEQLLGLTERMDSDAFLPLHSDELGQDFPRRMLNMVRLVDDATQRAVANDWADINGLRVAPQWYGFGRYLRLNGVVAWLGIDFRCWSGQGESPIWLHSQDGRWSDPIYLRTSVEYPAVLDFVVEQLGIVAQHYEELSASDG